MDKKSLYLCLILFVVSMLFGLGICVIVDTFNDEELKEENSKEFTDDDQIEDENNIDVSSKDEEKTATDAYEKVVHYSGDYVDLSSYIIEFDNKEENKDKLLTLVVDVIKLDEKEYKLSFKNHPQNCGNLNDYKGYNEFYINNKLIYTQNNQACYLERVQYLTIIDNKYIGITYEGQTGNYIKVYDKDIKLVDTFRYKDIEIKNGEIVYSEFVDDTGCYLNYFGYDIVNGNITKVFKKNVKNTECNQITGEGCDCDKSKKDGINFDLKNEKEKYIFDKLTLNFKGVKTGDINNEDSYQYTLDVVLGGKNIDSSIFGNKDKKIIWSSNYAALFKVVDIDNYYVLISHIAKQNDGSYVLVIDKEGNIVKTFEDVSVVINKEKLELKITDCESNNMTSKCPLNVYSLRDFK